MNPWPTFYEQVEAQQEEILSILRSVVSTWTENTMEDGNEPLLDDFLYEYKEWDNEGWYNVIVKERDRVAAIILRDRQKVETPAQW